MKILLDVHTHTVASGHAFSTLQEMAQAAAGKGLKLLGITEHPIKACKYWVLRNTRVAFRELVHPYIFGIYR